MAQQAVQKNTLYVGGLAEEVNESILHAAFIPFGDIKDVKTPLDQATQKHRSFGFVTFLEKEDASAAMDNMDGAELYGRVLTVNYALPERIKGGEQGWAAQPSEFPHSLNPNNFLHLNPCISEVSFVLYLLFYFLICALCSVLKFRGVFDNQCWLCAKFMLVIGIIVFDRQWLAVLVDVYRLPCI